MTRYQFLTIYGIMIFITGIFLCASAYNPSRIIQYVVAAGLFLSAIFAFITSYKSKNSTVPLKYHALQGFGLLAFAITIMIYATTLERFINATTCFLLFFGISEVMLAFSYLSLTPKIKMQIILFRGIVGFLTAFGAILILTSFYINPHNALLGSGIAFILGGTGFILFANLIRKFEMPSDRS